MTEKLVEVTDRMFERVKRSAESQYRFELVTGRVSTLTRVWIWMALGGVVWGTLRVAAAFYDGSRFHMVINALGVATWIVSGLLCVDSIKRVKRQHQRVLSLVTGMALKLGVNPDRAMAEATESVKRGWTISEAVDRAFIHLKAMDYYEAEREN